jgi:RhoGAP domain
MVRDRGNENAGSHVVLAPRDYSGERARGRELHVHVVDSSTSMWKSNSWFGSVRMSEAKRLLLNNVSTLSDERSGPLIYSALCRFAGVPSDSKPPAQVIVGTALHDGEQKRRFIECARLPYPADADLDAALRPEKGTRILEALEWVEENVVAPWVAEHRDTANAAARDAATSREERAGSLVVLVELYTDGLHDPVLDRDEAEVRQFLDKFDASRQRGEARRASIMFAFGNDVEVAKQVSFRIGCDSLVMVPDSAVAAKERDEIIFRVRPRLDSQVLGAGHSSSSAMIGFTYGSTREQMTAAKCKWIAPLALYIASAERVIGEDGIFRKVGRVKIVSQYVDDDRGLIQPLPSLEELDKLDPHTVGGLFKALVKAGPPLISAALAESMLAELRAKRDPLAMRALLDALGDTEPSLLRCLKAIFAMLYRVHLQSFSNNMTSHVLATVFAGSIVETKELADISSACTLIFQLIEHSSRLF